MGIYGVKPAFQRSLQGPVDWLVARGVHPDVLTWAALLLSVSGGLALATWPSQPLLLLWVPVVALMRTALNALDGLVATRSGLARPWGEVLNEFCDRCADTAIFGGLALAPTTNHLLGAAALVVILLNSYLSILSKAAGGPRQYGGVMGKADRMIWLSLAALAVLVTGAAPIFDAFLGLMLVGVLGTLSHRWAATRRDLAESVGSASPAPASPAPAATGHPT